MEKLKRDFNKANNIAIKNMTEYVSKKEIKDQIEHYQELQDNYIKKYDEINEGLEAMINALQELLEESEEKKKEALDETEKEYLKAVIKPFRNRVRWIQLIENSRGCYISISLRGESLNFENLNLPYFEIGTMYKGMEKGRGYTLKELGL